MGTASQAGKSVRSDWDRNGRSVGNNSELAGPKISGEQRKVHPELRPNDAGHQGIGERDALGDEIHTGRHRKQLQGRVIGGDNT